jgi:hypothetical protein
MMGRVMASGGQMGVVIFYGLQGVQVPKALLFVTSHSVVTPYKYPSYHSQPSVFLTPCIIFISPLVTAGAFVIFDINSRGENQMNNQGQMSRKKLINYSM